MRFRSNLLALTLSRLSNLAAHLFGFLCNTNAYRQSGPFSGPIEAGMICLGPE